MFNYTVKIEQARRLLVKRDKIDAEIALIVKECEEHEKYQRQYIEQAKKEGLLEE